MAKEEGAEFKLPSIPYFYHDIVARIIPGAIQLAPAFDQVIYEFRSSSPLK